MTTYFVEIRIIRYLIGTYTYYVYYFHKYG